MMQEEKRGLMAVQGTVAEAIVEKESWSRYLRQH
jgi:hypothetical protein